MDTHYVFIDFENIQPKAEALSGLNDERIKIIIFVNSTQKLPLDKVKALQVFGDRVNYIEMSGSGKNALDFIIAFYLGRMWGENPESKFYVVSQDTGFDPLLRHLTANRPGSAKRVSDCTKIKKHLAALKTSSEPATKPGTMKQRAARICAALLALPADSRPKATEALESFIEDTLNDCDLPEKHITGLVNFMILKELISIDQDGALKYTMENIAAGADEQFILIKTADEASPKPIPRPPVKKLAEKIYEDLDSVVTR